MTAIEQPAQESEFQTKRIGIIVGGHFIHDTYTAFLAPLLPTLQKQLSISLTQSSSLSVFLQLPALLNVLIGLMADKINLRYFVIFAPAVTGTLMSSIGLTNSYLSLSILLFCAGISVSAFHVPAPAMIGQISGRYVGRGMSFFMAGGELGRTVGPLLVVWVLATWGIDGIWRLALPGWAATAILYWQLHTVEAQPVKQKSGGVRVILSKIQRLFMPLVGLLLLSNFMLVGMSLFLVVFFEDKGYSVEAGGLALSLWQFAGVGGALMSGTMSDSMGRKPTIAAALVASALLMGVFLNTEGLWILPVLVLSGFTTLSITPVIQAIVLEHVPEQRATANGLFMLVSFVLRSIATMLIGIVGDEFGLERTFQISIILTILAIPTVFALPDLKTKTSPQ